VPPRATHIGRAALRGASRRGAARSWQSGWSVVPPDVRSSRSQREATASARRRTSVGLDDGARGGFLTAAACLEELSETLQKTVTGAGGLTSCVHARQRGHARVRARWRGFARVR
jgi:hypothetical protein